MDQDKIRQLVKKYIDGEATSEEVEQLLDWYRVTSNLEAEWVSSEQDEEDIVRERILMNIRRKRKNPFFKPFGFSYKVMASVLVILSLSAIFYFRPSSSKKSLTEQSSSIQPGKNQAILILSDGSKVALNGVKSGLLARQGGVVIRRTGNGQIVYDLSGQQSEKKGFLSFNTIVTPRGGQYQVVLPDGSNVWLNSESSLKFPTAFRGHERNVQLVGEAYFEVAKNKFMPFRVDVKGTQVEVLGTHFNIMGYDGEQTINTTLLEGSVKVSHNSKVSIIKPGQQAQVGDRIAVTDVDAEQSIAWKNGFFVFNDEDIHTLMNRIARWYDIEVMYEGNVSGLKFSGSVSKYKDVTQILKKMELTNTVHFKTEGRRITVME